MSKATDFANYARKLMVYIATVLTSFLSLDLLNDPYDKWATGILVILGGAGIYSVENKPKPIPTPEV